MVQSMLTEIVRRRLWPIPLIAVTVAVGAPLLFLKSAPVGAPLASAPAPAGAAEGTLPARAERLLSSSDAGPTGARHRAAHPSHDPFAPPSRHGSPATAAAGAAKAKAATKDSSAAKSPASDPVPVVITNANGSLPPKSASTPAPTPAPAPAVSGDAKPSLTVSSASKSLGGSSPG